MNDFVPQEGDHVRVLPGGKVKWTVWKVGEFMRIARLRSDEGAYRDELWSNLEPWSEQ